MIRAAARCSRAAEATIRGRTSSVRSILFRYSMLLKLIDGELSVPNANHVAIQMVDYDVGATAKTIKGLAELVKGSIESAESLFGGLERIMRSVKVASHFLMVKNLHATGNFEIAKEKNFGDAEETLTSDHYCTVGVILTGVALMYGNKAKQERSSSILILESPRASMET
ncbi:hypothetical protein EUTSA_v10015964mg [Eutrema salsugineum]|uniref:Uncharacterized protein n=1 Tax=Eutrema salsugineum TaxID=72664 RepID=V4LKV2_EUTSA|nr:hypothetical protein EUTSA_v10015964mg [Eutrema salsugineum]